MAIAALVFCLNVVFAQAPATSELALLGDSVSVPKSELKAERPSSFQFSGVLTTETIQYPTEIEDRPQLNQNNHLDVALEMDFENTWMSTRFQIRGAKSANLNSQYLAVQEAYAGAAGQTGFYLGRKINFWNQADQDWNLGLWQPLHLEDGLRPVHQGLTGLFYNYEGSAVQVLVYGSPVFIPTMNPELAEIDGELVSESRWFRPLPRRVSVLEARPTELVYRMRIPELKDLVLQPALGGRVRVGDLERGPWTALAFARKPMNTLQVRYDASVIARGAEPTGQIEVGPVAYRHEILSADIGWNFEKSRLGVSFVQDVPEIKRPENSLNELGFQTDYYQQQPRPLRLVSGHLSSSFKLPLVNRDLAWKLLYLRAQVEPSVEFDSQGIERSEFIPHRLIFTHAAVAQAQLQWSQAWSGAVRYLRDFDQQGTIWNFELEYRPGRWAARLGFDILGVDDIVAQETDNRFINSYRQNDRAYAGVSYVF